MVNSRIKFILASASPRRKELIGHLKVPFEIITLNIPEESESFAPVKFSQEIASAKGDAVFKEVLEKKIVVNENTAEVQLDNILEEMN